MKRVAVLIANGFEEIEALTVVDIMRRAKVECDMVSIESGLIVNGAHDIEVKCNKIIDSDINNYDCIVLPGGMPGATNLRDDERVINALRHLNENKKIVAAICAAPIVLAKANIISEKDITSYPGFEDDLQGCNYKEDRVVVCNNIITSRGPATAMEFAYKLLEVLGEESYKDISKGMLFN